MTPSLVWPQSVYCLCILNYVVSLISQFCLIITLLDGSNYNYQEVLNVLFRAATSSTNYLGYASNYLRSRISKIRIPSEDNNFNHLDLVAFPFCICQEIYFYDYIYIIKK